MQYAVLGLVAICRKTHVKQYPATVTPPKLFRLHMLAETSLGYPGWTWGIGLLAAWVNPGAADGWQWDYTCPNILLMGYYSLAVLMAYDAYSYPVHKWMHENKTAFNWMHRKHHRDGRRPEGSIGCYELWLHGAYGRGGVSKHPQRSSVCAGPGNRQLVDDSGR